MCQVDNAMNLIESLSNTNEVLLILAELLLITCPCCSERATHDHPRGTFAYASKFTFDFDDRINPVKTVTAFTHSATEDEPLFDPATDIKFYISKDNQSSPILIDLENLEAGNVDIDPEGQWYFGVHGYKASYVYSRIISPLIKDMQASGSSNIIHVDWEDGASSDFYPTVAANMRKVGAYVADVINSLVEKGLAKKDKIHLIGFSFGGHAVGFTGKSMISKYSWKLKRITGLDPGGPMFDGMPPDQRIDSSDAEYVEIFHACGGRLGCWNPVGLVDVYVNTGRQPQPGCDEDLKGGCSHAFAVKTYSGYTDLAMRSYRCTSFEDFASGHCDDDLQTYCEVGFKYPNCKEGTYHLDTTHYFN